MFATVEGTVDQALERRREARRCEVRSICEQQARLQQRLTEIVRKADDDGDWRAALVELLVVGDVGRGDRARRATSCRRRPLPRHE